MFFSVGKRALTEERKNNTKKLDLQHKTDYAVLV